MSFLKQNSTDTQGVMQRDQDRVVKVRCVYYSDGWSLRPVKQVLFCTLQLKFIPRHYLFTFGNLFISTV